MIINKNDKYYVERQDMPFENWIGEDFYLVNSNSELAEKIRAHCPHFDFVLDDEGNLVDITPIQSPELIEQKKSALIDESKNKLSEWLLNNPMLFSDGKYYSVTEEKQALLNSNLASYERATAAGIEYPLKWNSTGEVCTDWLYVDLLTLSLSIAGYVAPKVSIQQAIEIKVKACATMEELEAVVISYDD